MHIRITLPCSVALLALVVGSASAAPVPITTSVPASADLAMLLTDFVENRGQWTDATRFIAWKGDIVASLEDEGCQIVGPAATLQKALSLIESKEIDAALLDANLAGDPVDTLAAALVRRKIPFAFVSGYGREGLPEAYRQATLIKKPFQRQRLIDVIQQMLTKVDTVVPLRRTT